MSKLFPLIILAVILASCGSDAAPGATREAARKPAQAPAAGDSFDITNDDLNTALNDNNIILMNYDPIEPKQVDYKTVARDEINKLKSGAFMVVERESARDTNAAKRPNLMMAASQGDDAESSGSPNVEKMKDIAMNSREVRLVGPNQKEVEMKDDLPTKVVVALENLQKETKEVLSTLNDKLDKGWTDITKAQVWSQMNEGLNKGWTDVKKSEVWGKVNDGLDKGWTDLKSMVEGLVAPSSTANKSG